MSYSRSRETRRRLKRLYDETKHTYGAGAYYDDDKNRYVRYSCNDKNAKIICKRITRRRMAKLDNTTRGSYRKLYDYWWIIT